MRLDECYRLLELEPGASDEAVRRAYRDLTKVWHPDRFAHDPTLQARAQEKLKSINEAYETIRAAREEGWTTGQGSSGGGREEDPASVTRRTLRRYGSYAFACALAALVILLRRPTPGGLLIAAGLFIAAFLLVARMLRLARTR